MKKSLKWGNVYLVVVFAILYIPILYMALFSFNKAGTMVNFEGFTLKYYAEVFKDQRLIMIVLDTFAIALLSSTIAVVIGVFGALAIRYAPKRQYKNSILTLNNVLIVSPDVIIGASFLILFTMIGLKLGFASVLIAHIAFSVPIVVLMVLPKLNEMSPSLVRAAQDLGANQWQVLTKVILPSLTPGIFAGFFMALTYSLDDFAVTFFVTGNGFSTLGVEIYSRARTGVSLSINAISTILFVSTLALVLGYYAISSKEKKKQGVTK
ncbi:ABC transporter permease [Brochothrix thermosphacta]|uniref:ABC transporter permease n=1 Tax=Brochothrix thermosphacta TaxID=2756 RepID=UPI000E74D9FC|nr:ABC transporter permease [Brochothrix thermosphacta]ANZ94696.1 spermidine/putrescine ABC transporter permease PotC [Brochothrix thermosphacta]HCZ39392.1 spermidine/putrescine ABC transporter permease PotC [Brochothrix thermosphacta]HCZ45656.1 spermidine/putrescine ABC transporter permease PotC [Brochothrix thermosphacta]